MEGKWPSSVPPFWHLHLVNVPAMYHWSPSNANPAYAHEYYLELEKQNSISILQEFTLHSGIVSRYLFCQFIFRFSVPV